MTVQITIIGLGQTGTSIGLALAKYADRIKRVGFDRVLETQNKAKSLGALDEVKFNLPATIEGADLVLLCIPLDQVEETLKLIAEDLREDAVVIDFAPQKMAVKGWFEAHIPAGRHYVGLVPSVGPQYLGQVENGIEGAHADLFERATIGIAAPAGTSSQALKLATDLVELLGGQSIFLDMLEADGMALTAHLLPQVLSVALLNATVGQPGWAETRRFAGRPFLQGTLPLGSDTPEALSKALLTNPAGSAAVLNNLIGALTHLRSAVERGDSDDLQKRLKLAFSDRETWLNERTSAEWNEGEKRTELPNRGEFFKRLFSFGGSKDRK
jgi:prephenate dehydrogenase